MKKQLAKGKCKPGECFIVLGAGATACTFCHFLAMKGFKIILLNRGKENMMELENRFNQHIIETLQFS